MLVDLTHACPCTITNGWKERASRKEEAGKNYMPSFSFCIFSAKFIKFACMCYKSMILCQMCCMHCCLPVCPLAFLGNRSTRHARARQQT